MMRSAAYICIHVYSVNGRNGIKKQQLILKSRLIFNQPNLVSDAVVFESMSLTCVFPLPASYMNAFSCEAQHFSEFPLVVQTCCFLKLVSSIFKAPDPIYASWAELEPDQELEPSNSPSSKTLLIYFISSASFTKPILIAGFSLCIYSVLIWCWQSILKGSPCS